MKQAKQTVNAAKWPLNQAIGGRLRAVRLAHGLSQMQLSRLTGGVLGKSRICWYENGSRRMSIETAEVLAATFGDVSPAYLLCLTDV